MKNKSKFRKLYIKRLIIRIIIFIGVLVLYIFKPNSFNVVKGLNFIKEFSILHILWLIWIIEMVLKLCNIPSFWPLGSQKVFFKRFIPDKKLIDKDLIKNLMKELNRDSITVAIVWTIFVLIIDSLYLFHIVPYQIIVLFSVAFYVCDVICIVAWCPFRVLIMRNKCCTTCRIFNWDHSMMFLPLIVIPGLYTYSLIIMAFIVLIVWEVSCASHPERFMEKTNCALRCQNCKDKLCGKNGRNI